MKVNAIVQARCGSSRFPKKVFSVIDNKPLIWHVVNRLRSVSRIDNIIIATTINSIDDEIANWCYSNGVKCFRGSENDVLNRFYMASQEYPSDVIVRITADDPFKEPALIDYMIEKFMRGGYDYLTNNYPPTYPEGLDCEVFSKDLLIEMEKKSRDAYEREHVTQYVFRHLDEYSIGNVKNDTNLSSLRWTIDTVEDLEMVNSIYKNRIINNKMLLMDEILEIIRNHPEIKQINSNIERSAMYKGE